MIAIASVVSIYTIINMFEKLNYFLQYRSTFLNFVLYYLYILPSFISLLLPVGAILSSFMVAGRMVKNNEVTALLSSGISVYRIFLPFFISGGILSLFHFTMSETLMRKTNSLFYELKETKIEKKSKRRLAKYNIFYYGDSGRVFFIKYLNATTKRMRSITMWEITSQKKITKRVDAENGFYKNGVWIVENATIRKFKKDKDEIKERRRMVLKELDASPLLLVKRAKHIEELTIPELLSRKERLKRAGIEVTEEEVDFNFRFSTPFITLVMLLLSLPLAIKIRKKGVTFGIGLGLLFSFIFWGFLQTFKAFGYAGLLSPPLSAWISNLVFGTIGIFLFFTTKT